MSKFKIGDIIKGISDEYRITNREMTKEEIEKELGYKIKIKED